LFPAPGIADHLIAQIRAQFAQELSHEWVIFDNQYLHGAPRFRRRPQGSRPVGP
jgi:hypothetical protein